MNQDHGGETKAYEPSKGSRRQNKHDYSLVTISTAANGTKSSRRLCPTPSSDEKDIIAKADDVIQFQGDVLLVRNPHVIDEGLQGRNTGKVFDWGYQGDASQMDRAPAGHPCPPATGTARIQGALAQSQPGEELSSWEKSTPASSSHGQVRAPQLRFKARCSEGTSREIYLSTNCKWNFSPHLQHINEVPEVRNFRCSWFSSTLHDQQEQLTVQAHTLNYWAGNRLSAGCQTRLVSPQGPIM